MTLIVETGAGLRNSNSYVTVAALDTYLTDRARETENSWDTATTAQKEAALILATQYIDTRWGGRFKGVRNTSFSGNNAVARATFSGLPTADDTITVGDQVYTWKAAIDELSSDQVLIGADAAECVTNLVAMINSGDTAGTNYSQYSSTNAHCTAAVNADNTAVIDLTSRMTGLSGNDIAFTESSDNFTIDQVFAFGSDRQTQSLMWPRTGIHGDDGRRVIGIPEKLKWATCEYAIRAHSASLYQDPSVDASGRAVIKEKIGPIETQFAEGSSLDLLIKPYPAADNLLREYLYPAGRVHRG